MGQYYSLRPEEAGLKFVNRARGCRHDESNQELYEQIRPIILFGQTPGECANWPEIQDAHQTWWKNYNVEDHYAHRERQDGRHSPLAVLRGMLGHTIPEEVLSRALYASQFTRQIDQHGYVRFKHWKLYGENGLAGEEVSVWVYEDTLKGEHQGTTLSLYSVRLSADQKTITEVRNARRLETHFRSPQLHLWQVSDTEWLLALRRSEPITRKKPGKLVAHA